MDTSHYVKSNKNIELNHKSPLAKIKYIVIDVDGTMTDGGVYYDEQGNELKKFCTRDAAGFFTAKVCGIITIVVTGRECKATTRRMKELHVGELYQGVVDKVTFLKDYIMKHNINKDELAYIGDDLNDFSGMRLSGFVGCPSDAVEEIKQISNYISVKKGGHGAVRDIIKYLLKERGQWNEAITECYGM